MEEKVYTPQELADIWKCTPETVNGLCRNGELTAFKVGDLWRIKECEKNKFEEKKSGAPLRTD